MTRSLTSKDKGPAKRVSLIALCLVACAAIFLPAAEANAGGPIKPAQAQPMREQVNIPLSVIDKGWDGTVKGRGAPREGYGREPGQSDGRGGPATDMGTPGLR